jgi:hypothetical protein
MFLIRDYFGRGRKLVARKEDELVMKDKCDQSTFIYMHESVMRKPIKIYKKSLLVDLKVE